ncbi:keratin-associated protein 13-2-like [Arvicola amphibius]|uniref:keratin-associated protein 13-2-like n=1 Tax=Arvicola amphibius TaxID=1047088 RepID=UPI0018E387A4|nr:keratin-associated protein 13-2-like [Arvicola amphibius]
MANSCCSGAFSSCSLRHCMPTTGSLWGSSYPSNLVYTTTSCSPSLCQLESSVNTGCQEPCIEPTSCQRSCVVSRPFQVESSLNTGCQETCIEPTSCQRSCVVSRPCQTALYYHRSSTLCSPCRGSYAGSLGFWCSSCQSLGCGSGSCYSGGYGSSGFRSMAYRLYDFPILSDGSRICYPTYLAASSRHPCC